MSQSARIRLPVFTNQAPDEVRLPVTWLQIAVVAGAFFVIELVAMKTGQPAAGDRHLDLWIHRHLGPATYTFFRAITNVGSVWPRIVVMTGLLVLLLLARRFWSAALLVAAGGGGDLVEQMVNHAVARPRPHLFPHAVNATGYSFPSGHSTGACALCLVLAYLAWHLTGRKGIAALAGVLAALLAGLVGLSRIVLGVHYPTDVLGGFLFATAWVSGMIFLLSPLLQGERLAGAGPPRI